MDCPKCNGETERGVEKCTNDMESLREEMSQTMDKYANEMESLREKIEYKSPVYSSTSVVYPSWYRQSY